MQSTRKHSCQGFSLLELIVVIAIMVILAGLAAPVTTKVLNYKARVATNEELQTLANAAGDYFRDCWQLPESGEGLLVHSGVGGWSGPYLAGVVADSLSGSPGYLVDAWSSEYSFIEAGDTLTIRSGGPDRTSGNADDLTITLDVTPIRRKETLARLDTINQAITLYNGTYLLSDPLSSSYSAAFAKLVSAGFLPNSTDYQYDAWGDSYLADPIGANPLVRAASPNVAETSESGSDDWGDEGGEGEDEDDRGNDRDSPDDHDQGRGNDGRDGRSGRGGGRN